MANEFDCRTRMEWSLTDMGDIKDSVRENYGRIARQSGASFCGSAQPGRGVDVAGDTATEKQAAPAGADIWVWVAATPSPSRTSDPERPFSISVPGAGSTASLRPTRSGPTAASLVWI